MKKKLWLLGVAALMAGGANATLITASTTHYVRGGNKGAVWQDSSEEIWFKGIADQNQGRFTFIRFALTDAQKAEVLLGESSVTLDMYLLAGNTAGTTLKVYGLADGADAGAGTTETTWDTTMVWNERPDGDSALDNALTTFIGDTVLPADSVNTLVQLTLGKAALDALITADTNNEITFLIGDTAYNESNKFASLTNTSGYAVPTLNVVPEPATLGLIGASGIALLFIRRRIMM